MGKKLILLIIPLLCLFGCTEIDEDFSIDGDLVVTGSIIKPNSDNTTGGYWHEYNMPAIELSPGASGATLTVANANTLGGYQLDAIGEYLYYDTHLEDDWDSVSDLIFELTFEVNVDNTGGLVTDTTDFTITCYHKAVGDTTTDQHPHNGSIVVGQAAQYQLFKISIPLDYIADGYLVGDTIAYRINLDTANSDIDDVIINYVEMRYRSYNPALEVD